MLGRGGQLCGAGRAPMYALVKAHQGCHLNGGLGGCRIRESVGCIRHINSSNNWFYSETASESKKELAANRLTLLEARELLDSGSITSVELTEMCIKQIHAVEGAMNGYISLNEERALEKAHALDSERQSKRKNKLGILEGIPLSVKDNYSSKGIQTTAGSFMLGSKENPYVAPFDSTVCDRLFNQHDAILLGKNNMDEFAMGSLNIESAFGPVVNPVKPTHAARNEEEAFVAGGSSGGSAAAVASWTCFASMGTDTGGSVRIPASYTGCVGFKPSYGRISRYGLVMYASSLDTPGVLARSVRDAAAVYSSIAGQCDFDSTSLSAEVEDWDSLDTFIEGRGDKGKRLEGIKVGIPKEYFTKELPKDIVNKWKAAIGILENELGATVVEVSLPNTDVALPAYYVLGPAEASSNLARFDGIEYGARVEECSSVEKLYSKTRSQYFGKEVVNRILTGTFCLSKGSYESYYVAAQKARGLVISDFESSFGKGTHKGVCDCILCPTSMSSAPSFKECKDWDVLNMYVNDVFTVPASLAGLPAVSIPSGVSESSAMPVGLQVLGKRFDERTVLKVANMLSKHIA
eukprot:Nk52_evm115s352 gene=Nk52_evmTU115s352